MGEEAVDAHRLPAALLPALPHVPALLPAHGAWAVPRQARRAGRMTALAAAYAECAALARSHYEDFPIGAWLLPRRLRDDLAAVYAFARLGDDVADEGDASP